MLSYRAMLYLHSLPLCIVMSNVAIWICFWKKYEIKSPWVTLALQKAFYDIYIFIKALWPIFNPNVEIVNYHRNAYVACGLL